MLTLLLPLFIAVASGMEPPVHAGATPDDALVTGFEEADDRVAELTADLEQLEREIAEAMAESGTRQPEPQIATGQWTVAVEVKPILGMTKSNWVAVRLYEGQDLLYFSHLLAFRCGLWEIRWGVNGEPATNQVALEPCHTDTAQPNALTDPLTYPIYVTLPPESVTSVFVEIVYDDGTTDFARFDRNQILIP